MPPWLNPWLLAAVAMSMALHFLILLVPPLPVSFCPAPILFCDRVQIFLQQSGPVLVTGPLWALLLWKLPGRLGVGRSEGAWCKQLVLWEPSDLGNQRGGDKTPCCGESLEARAGGDYVPSQYRMPPTPQTGPREFGHWVRAGEVRGGQALLAEEAK